MQTNILLIEDDESLNRGIAFKLQREGFHVFSANCLQEGRAVFNKEKIDLIILDVGLPDGDGFQFCKEIRETSTVLIIFLTACVEEVDIVTGYDLGADDYITKPFSFMVLMSKINAVLRRATKPDAGSTIRCAELTYFPQMMKVYKNSEEVFLSKTEFKLFQYLINNPQQVIAKEQFLSQLWDIEGDFLNESTLPVNIRRLREKLRMTPLSLNLSRPSEG